MLAGPEFVQKLRRKPPAEGATDKSGQAARRDGAGDDRERDPTHEQLRPTLDFDVVLRLPDGTSATAKSEIPFYAAWLARRAPRCRSRSTATASSSTGPARPSSPAAPPRARPTRLHPAAPRRRTEAAFAGLTRQAQLVRDGEVSSRELVELSLERIERFDRQLNAFGAVYAERALAESEQPRPGPLSGVPIAVKDEDGHRGARSPAAGPARSRSPPRRTPRWCAGCGPRARSSSARPRCPSSGCGRSPSR